MRRILCILLSSCVLFLGAILTRASRQPQSSPEQKPPTPKNMPVRQPDIYFVPTPPEVVRAMLQMANVRKGDVVYDLGCGDGRIVIAAAQVYGVRGVGIDIDPQRIKEAEENAKKAGVEKLVKFRQGDLFETDFKEATVVTLYLLERLNEKLKPRLLSELKPGSRIVSHAFGMGDWPPEKTEDVDGRMVYLWTVPGATKKQ